MCGVIEGPENRRSLSFFPSVLMESAQEDDSRIPRGDPTFAFFPSDAHMMRAHPYFTEEFLMSRINQNVGSMVAQRVLSQQNMDLSQDPSIVFRRVFESSRGSDDPAGLIASENLRAEKVAINSAMNNAERAEQVVNVAEGGLQEISSMLVELQSLVDLDRQRSRCLE